MICFGRIGPDELVYLPEMNLILCVGLVCLVKVAFCFSCMLCVGLLYLNKIVLLVFLWSECLLK